MSANAMLVRWPQGWHWVANVTGLRREMPLGLSCASVAEVETVALAQIDILGTARDEITVGLLTKTDADRFGIGYIEGDSVLVPDRTGALTEQRIMSVTCTWDGQDVKVVPQLNAVISSYEKRIDEIINKQTQGATGGVTRAPQPVSTIAQDSTCCPPDPAPGPS